MGWIANIFIVIGLYLVGNKNRKAFVFTIIGETIWAVRAGYLGMWDMAIICVVFSALAVRNWIEWGKPEPGPLKPGDVAMFSGNVEESLGSIKLPTNTNQNQLVAQYMRDRGLAK